MTGKCPQCHDRGYYQKYDFDYGGTVLFYVNCSCWSFWLTLAPNQES